ncbi:DUF5615 family PIN-like protein [Polaromonas sp. P1-6]|nr:DUF5615 family PIN-like protein [Polaromonas sp. P1-6]
MKLLLDDNLSRRLVPLLQHDYPGSTQVALIGLESAMDRIVWEKTNGGGSDETLGNYQLIAACAFSA